jgi:hypothetical protein
MWLLLDVVRRRYVRAVVGGGVVSLGHLKGKIRGVVASLTTDHRLVGLSGPGGSVVGERCEASCGALGTPSVRIYCN